MAGIPILKLKEENKMALFGKKETKSPFDKLLNDYNNLSPQDQKAFHDKIMDVEKAEDEREIDKVEEEKADTTEVADEKAEEVKEESDEIGKDVDNAEETAEVEEEAPATEEDGAEDDSEAVETAEEDVEEAGNAKLEALMEEFTAYKEKVDKLYERLEEVDKPAESVGLGKQKDVDTSDNEDDNMSAYEYAMKNAKF